MGQRSRFTFISRLISLPSSLRRREETDSMERQLQIHRRLCLTLPLQHELCYWQKTLRQSDGSFLRYQEWKNFKSSMGKKGITHAHTENLLFLNILSFPEPFSRRFIQDSVYKLRHIFTTLAFRIRPSSPPVSRGRPCPPAWPPPPRPLLLLRRPRSPERRFCRFRGDRGRP